MTTQPPTPSSLSSAIVSLLEKAATDNGFDRESPTAGAWLAFASTQCPLQIWLGMTGAGSFAAAFSQHNVALAVGECGSPLLEALPAGAKGGRVVPDIPVLHRLLRRAFQLSKSLPDALLKAFQARTVNLPQCTEAERLLVERVGQHIFRAGLLEYWEGRCAITGLAVPELLRASHIKPWAECSTDAERLDVDNGFLLAPQWDAAFDRGFITVEDSGAVTVSPRLDAAARQALSLDDGASVRMLSDNHRAYLNWHRERVFRAD